LRLAFEIAGNRNGSDLIKAAWPSVV